MLEVRIVRREVVGITAYLHHVAHFTVEKRECRRLVENEMSDPFHVDSAIEMESFTIEKQVRLTMEKHVSGSSHLRILKQ